MQTLVIRHHVSRSLWSGVLERGIRINAGNEMFAAVGRVAAQQLSVAVFLLVLFTSGVAWGHFNLNLNFRAVHFERLNEGMRIYMRLPMALVVAGLTGPPDAAGVPAAPPYTRNQIENGQLMHYIDVAALVRDPIGLGKLAAQGHIITIDGRRVPATVEAVRVLPGLMQTQFISLEDVKVSFTGPPYPEGQPPAYVGDTVLDVKLFYRTNEAVSRYTFASTLNPGLQDQEKLANLLFDHDSSGAPTIFRAVGLLEQPVKFDLHTRIAAQAAEAERTAFFDAKRFTLEGIRHILEGYDHVLFILCLTIGATGLTSLIWRATGFTLGHTITLILGFFGFVPHGGWFIPSVEMGIALTIIYAAMIAIMKRPGAGTFFVTTAIGMLHGLGFSFILHELLKVDSPNLWVSLISFNLGVEIGQAILIIPVWLLLVFGARYLPLHTRYTRDVVAAASIVVAAIWTFQRAQVLLA